ncbi:TPA: metallophosphoesterase [Clostridioides difficile]|uniref:metallophosphoesterase n=1 Tax=Clostridioides difficile TaxID=1496 RepID=UPI002A4B8F6B|nr:metallophosphoesterase [Clostridioides difficile]
MFRILHLSDIHIGKTYAKSEDIAYKIIFQIEENNLCPIESVIVTGDIFDGQVGIEEVDGKPRVKEELINEAVRFFEILINQINLIQVDKKLEKGDFIFVPGNHDLIRDERSDIMWSKYNTFLERFYNEFPKHYNKDYSVIKKYEHSKIVFVGFNSCKIEKRNIFDEKYIDCIDKNTSDEKLSKIGIKKEDLIKLLQEERTAEYDDYGEIPIEQIITMKRSIKNIDEYNVIALFHHHFYLFPEVSDKYGDSSLVRNHTQLVQFMKSMNVKTIFHGHKHFDLERPFITEDYYQTTDSIIDIFAGGSVGAKIKDKHTFSVIDFFDKNENIKLKQYKFIYEDESLKIDKKQIPPKNISNKIVKILEILKSVNYDVFKAYQEEYEKLRVYNTCEEIISWTSKAVTGFEETYKYLKEDYRNILFLLYAINYRTLRYENIIDNIRCHSNFEILKKFYEKWISIDGLEGDKICNILDIKNINELTKKCDEVMDSIGSKSLKRYLAFTMLGVFFSDLYLIMNKYADDFYKNNVKYKVNIKIEDGKFHENVPSPRIDIKSDVDRRSVYIEFLCNDATSHKIAVLFVKEFDLILNKFEDYFKLLDLKIYYLIAKVEKNNLKNALDNYNFEAYIPTLLPLLIGNNIYSSKEVFARELIQNSIDAIAVREAKDDRDFNKDILIELGIDKNNRKFFKIKDNGTGMDRHKIERYFTSIGRSFYSGDEYKDLKINYKPISSFGIGFLSSFMACKEIDVKTKSYLDNSEPLRLHIPNYEGCFFVENEIDSEIGTEIKLYLNQSVNFEKILDYIHESIKDIKYNILIKTKDKSEKINYYEIRKKNKLNVGKFFIPLKEDGDVLDIEWKEEVLSNNFISNYEYGLLVNYEKKLPRKDILNAGIVVKKVDLNDIFQNNDYLGLRVRSLSFSLNLPNSWIELDVSRDNIANIENIIKCNFNCIRNEIASKLEKQVFDFLEYCKENTVNTPMLYIEETFRLSDFIRNDRTDFNHYFIIIEKEDNNYVLSIEHNESEFYEHIKMDNKYITFGYSVYFKLNDSNIVGSRISTRVQDIIKNNLGRAIPSPQNIEQLEKRVFIELNRTLKSVGLKSSNIKLDILELLGLYLMYIESSICMDNISKNYKNRFPYMNYFLYIVLNNISVSNVQQKKNKIYINYKKIEELFFDYDIIKK